MASLPELDGTRLPACARWALIQGEEPFPSRDVDLFGADSTLVRVVDEVGSLDVRLTRQERHVVDRLAHTFEDAVRLGQWDVEGGLRLPSDDRHATARHRAGLQGFAHLIRAVNVDNGLVDVEAARRAAESFDAAWPDQRRFPAPGPLNRDEVVAGINDQLLATLLEAFDAPWSVGQWLVWDALDELRGSRRQRLHRETHRAEATVLLYGGENRGLVGCLHVELVAGERAGFWPSLLRLGATHVRTMPQSPHGGDLAQEPHGQDLFASLRRAWEVSGLSALPVRGRWWFGAHRQAKEPWHRPLLEGRSCEAAACCALWAAWGGVPGESSAGVRSVPMDPETPLTATLETPEGHVGGIARRAYRLGEVKYVPEKTRGAIDAQLAGKVLTYAQAKIPDGSDAEQLRGKLRPLKTVGEAYEAMCRSERGKELYQAKAAAEFWNRWAESTRPPQFRSDANSTGQDLAPPTRDLPPFIADQAVHLLTDWNDPRSHLRTDAFRRLRNKRQGKQAEGPRDDESNFWQEISRQDLQSGVARHADRDISLRRLVITSDAGLGKSATLAWLAAQESSPESPNVAFVIRAAELGNSGARGRLLPELASGGNGGQAPKSLLLDSFANRLGITTKSELREAAEYLYRLRDRGELTILVDGLDELAPESGAVRALAALVADEHWSHCRIVLAGRPYAIDQVWPKVIKQRDGGNWRFLLVGEFTEEQQRTYLGLAKSHFERLFPSDMREILEVPRVLSYLRLFIDRLDPSRPVHTASDIYWTAVCHLIQDGMRGGAESAELASAMKNVDPADLEFLLAAIAFQMSVVDQGNFDRAERKSLVSSLLKRPMSLKSREWTEPRIKKTLTALASLNAVLSHGLIEHGFPRVVQFRNRSLQEFFAALWMAKYATEEQLDELSERLPLAHDEASQAWYWVFRFATEMPETALDERDRIGRNPEAWIRSMSAVFCRGDGTAAGTKRASEMIARAWPTLYDHYVVAKQNPDARKLVEHWRSEFQEEFLDKGNPFAKELTESFVKIPGGTLKMGSPNADEMRDDDDEPEELELQIEPFSICRFPMLNGFYRLYDPGHGRSGREYRYEKYDKVSPGDRHPAISVSWWDARASSLWFRWKDQNGRFVEATLPNEAQHEWIAKDCPPPGQPYRTNWWGDEFASEHCHSSAQRTAEVPKWTEGMKHPRLTPNWRVFDITGNVWQWCLNVYRERVSSLSDVQQLVGGPRRSFRGGSWGNAYPGNFRAAYRSRDEPCFRNDCLGFRLALVRSG